MKHSRRYLITKYAVIFVGFCFFMELMSWFFLPPTVIHQLPGVEFQADPVCGYRLKQTDKAYTLGSPVTVNSWGFRGSNWQKNKPANTKRVAVLGSSYAFGHGVTDEQMFSSRLQELLNHSSSDDVRYEVMSFGLGGYDAGHELCVLENYALSFKPDIVVLAFFFNDIFVIKNYDFYGEMFRLQKAHFKPWRWHLTNFFRRSRLLMFLWDYYKDKIHVREPGEVGEAVEAYVREGIAPPKGPQSEGWIFVASQIKRFRQLADAQGFTPILIIVPTHHEMLSPGNRPPYVNYVLDQAEQNRISAWAMIDVFRTQGHELEKLLIPYDYHLSFKGHEIIAQSLYDYMNSSQATARSSKV